MKGIELGYFIGNMQRKAHVHADRSLSGQGFCLVGENATNL
jgi:hypothetical protein